jgi:hypothetical protein
LVLVVSTGVVGNADGLMRPALGYDAGVADAGSTKCAVGVGTAPRGTGMTASLLEPAW